MVRCPVSGCWCWKPNDGRVGAKSTADDEDTSRARIVVSRSPARRFTRWVGAPDVKFVAEPRRNVVPGPDATPTSTGVHRNVKALTPAVLAYTAETNQDAKPLRWTKSADDILQSLN